jgi:hypothetical protein
LEIKVWDATDINYMVKNLSIPQLNKEINNAKNRNFEDIDYDYIWACQLAIDILKSYQVDVHSHVIGDKKVFESIESLKRRHDIVDFIGQYVVLRKSGNKFVGVCPFHSEKKGSFFVYAENQTWHCFGACNTGGDIITFIQKYENLEIKDAIKRLAS